MRILLSTADVALQGQLRTELEAAGHKVVPWKLDTEPDAEAELAIVHGLDGVIEAYELTCHILALVDSDELRLFPECPRDVVDFVLEPLRPGEVAARVDAIALGASRRQQIHEHLLASAVEHSGDVFQITTAELVIEHVNYAHEALLGRSGEDVIGRRLVEVLSPADEAPEVLAHLEQILSDGERWSGTLVAHAEDGRLLQFDSSITPIMDVKGEVTHYACVSRDITERLERRRVLEEANKALARARDAAIEASKAKSEFLANMSHELRTPLNAIIGYSEMLIESVEDDPQTTSDLGRVRTAGVHLLGLINDVLDISKIEANRVDLVLEDFDLAALVDEVSAATVPLAAKNDNTFEVVGGDVLGTIHADRMRLEQVLLNLLSNACKFTKQGEVTLAVERTTRAGAPWVEFRVQDSGIGISESQQSRLFQPFVQADASTTREFGGTGLGLVISKRLCELMRGEIRLESVAGEGSTFIIALPSDSSRTSAVTLAGGDARTVLLIDDDDNIRDLFARVLSERGFSVHATSQGAEGIALAAQLQPDAIVLDVKMPGMDGWEVLSTLKLTPATAAIPVIMLTVLHQQDLGRALGAVDYLIKPVDPLALTSALSRHLAQRPAHVLLVEDDEPTRELLRRTLEQHGHQVVEARHGLEALEELEVSTPDLIVLDLMMPVMDGFAFLHRLRAQPEHSDLPVIVATARTLSAEERSELETMAQNVVKKEAHTRRELMTMIGDQVDAIVEKKNALAGYD